MTALLFAATALLAGSVGFLICCFLAAGVIARLREDKHKLIAYINYLEDGGELADQVEEYLRESGS